MVFARFWRPRGGTTENPMNFAQVWRPGRAKQKDSHMNFARCCWPRPTVLAAQGGRGGEKHRQSHELRNVLAAQGGEKNRKSQELPTVLAAQEGRRQRNAHELRKVLAAQARRTKTESHMNFARLWRPQGAKH